MGGTSFSWDQRQNRKGIFQFFFKKNVFLLNEWKCNIAQIASIAAFIANSSEYDLVLLQDLWMRPDHETIRAALPMVIHNKLSRSSGKIIFCINLQNRVMTRVGDLAPALCDGRVLPTSCSGLALVSRCLKGLHHFRSIHFADMLWPWLRFWQKIGHGNIYRFPILETEFKVFSVHGLVLDNWQLIL